MNHTRRQFLVGLGTLASLGGSTLRLQAEPPAAKETKSPSKNLGPHAKDAGSDTGFLAASKPLELFDGKSLAGWKITDYAGHGEVRVDKERIILDAGERLTGITTTRDKELPRMGYEISLEAMRLDGGDFFCGLTFPVNKDPCSFIVGGWGGTVVGLSSINGSDASENETSQGKNFESNRWYRIRTRVVPGRIQCWIDQEQMVDLETADKEIGIRIEVEPSTPLGIATYQTTAALRKIRIVRV